MPSDTSSRVKLNFGPEGKSHFTHSLWTDGGDFLTLWLMAFQFFVEHLKKFILPGSSTHQKDSWLSSVVMARWLDLPLCENLNETMAWNMSSLKLFWLVLNIHLRSRYACVYHVRLLMVLSMAVLVSNASSSVLQLMSKTLIVESAPPVTCCKKMC